ncbi:MAG: TonB family protein [Candidatus Sulfotelmatobacter sp.]
MGYEALLFCPDEKTARTVTQVLSELEFNVEACLEPFAAVKKLMGQHFDAVVVDCDNEQNATLLFKSARNSTSNQASLAVAVVEGQAGVAKAFRIGANLVLTKPINIEQSKGTLRVARGLLRKGDPSKPAAAAPAPGTASAPAAAPAKPVAAKPVLPARPAVPAKPAAVAAPRPAAPPVVKPAAKPPTRPAVAAATTSIPAAHAPAAQTPVYSPLPASGHSAAPAEDPSRISAEDSAAPAPEAALTASARIAALPTRVMKLPASMPSATAVKPPSSTSSPATFGSGAASAPAPAREAEEPQVAEISLESAALETAPASDKPAEASASEPGYVGTAPAFTFGGANLPEEKTGKSKKTFLGVAAVVLVGGALYYGWTQYKGTVSQPVPVPTATKPLPAAPKPATPSSIPPSSTASGTTPTDSKSQSGSQPIATPAASPNDNGNGNDEDDSPDATAPASTKPAGSAPSAAGKASGSDKTGSDKSGSDKTGLDKTGPDKTGSDKTGSDKTEPDKTGSAKTGSGKSAASPLVVKGGTTPTLQAAGSAPDAPAPSMTGIAAAGAVAPPPNLGGTGSVTKPVLQTMSISQGVSRGLLIHQVAPIYPKSSIAMRIEGTVQLSTIISKTGDITHVKIVSGDPQLAKAAADAVKQWKYKPYLLNGEPVDIQTQVTVNFKLPN